MLYYQHIKGVSTPHSTISSLSTPAAGDSCSPSPTAIFVAPSFSTSYHHDHVSLLRYFTFKIQYLNSIPPSCSNPNASGLSLSAPVRDEVRKSSKQYLSCDNRRIHITTAELYHEEPLKFFLNGNMSSVLVPLDSTTYQTLCNIETFVVNNVDSPKYKPLRLKEAMYVNVSKWCEYERIHDNGTRSIMQSGMTLGKGFYSMVIHPSHVYIGPHRGGETFSLSLHVIKISYKESEDIGDLIECLNADTTGLPPTPAPTSVTPVLAPQPSTSTAVPAAAAPKRRARARKHDTPPPVFAGTGF